MTGKYKKIIGIFILVAIIMLIGFTLVFTEKGFYTNMKLSSEKNSLRYSLDSIRKANDSLRNEINLLQNNDFKIEKVAREKYSMVRPGEKVYKIENQGKK